MLNHIIWELISPLSVQQISPQVVDLLKRLQQVSEDSTLALLRVDDGSAVLLLQEALVGFKRVQHLFETDQLSTALGIPILSVAQRETNVIQFFQRGALSQPRRTVISSFNQASHAKQPVQISILLRIVIVISAAFGGMVAILFEFCLFTDFCSLSFEGLL